MMFGAAVRGRAVMRVGVVVGIGAVHVVEDSHINSGKKKAD